MRNNTAEVLDYIRRNDKELNVHQIMDILKITRTEATRCLNVLVQQGYLTEIITDRYKLYQITPKGLRRREYFNIRLKNGKLGITTIHELKDIDLSDSEAVHGLQEIPKLLEDLLDTAKEVANEPYPSDQLLKLYTMRINLVKLHLKHTQRKLSNINYLLKQAIPAIEEEGLKRFTNFQGNNIPTDY